MMWRPLLTASGSAHAGPLRASRCEAPITGLGSSHMLITGRPFRGCRSLTQRPIHLRRAVCTAASQAERHVATARSLRQAVGSVADVSKRTRPVVTGHRALAALAVLSRSAQASFAPDACQGNRIFAECRRILPAGCRRRRRLAVVARQRNASCTERQQGSRLPRYA